MFVATLVALKGEYYEKNYFRIDVACCRGGFAVCVCRMPKQ